MQSRSTTSTSESEAATHEIESNTDVRRLMFVVVNIVLPCGAMAVAACLSGSDYPPALAWLPGRVVLVSGLLLLTGTIVAVVLMRCHYGMVVNSAKMDKVETGRW